jgi:hypothetical protein
MRHLLLLASVAAATFAASGAWAVVPAAYEAMVLQPQPQPQPLDAGAMAFDLSPAVERARREGRRIYLYLGAHDCPYCKRYEAFLDAHAAELKPHFAPYLFVELRGALTVTAQHLHFKLAGRVQPYAEFMRSLGDERATRLVYPTVWLLDAQPKPLMQMPAGAGTFMTVPEQIEVLQLQQ